MNEHLVLGLFALYVVFASLFGILSGACDASLALMRGMWGRIRGLSIYFCVHVGLPFLVGVVFVGWGIVNFTPVGADIARRGSLDVPLEINWHQVPLLQHSEENLSASFVMPLCA